MSSIVVPTPFAVRKHPLPVVTPREARLMADAAVAGVNFIPTGKR